MKLCDILKNYREENKISQREFARRCGLSNSSISILEMGVNPQTGKEMSPDLETYSRIASAMGMSLQTLFEKLGNDATVRLVSMHMDEKDIPYPYWVDSGTEDKASARDDDMDLIEALHQNPKLRMLFDIQKNLSESDLNAVLGVVNAIAKERGDDD